MQQDASLETLLATYVPSIETLDLVRTTPIVLLVGVSGAGKDSIKQCLLMSGTYHHIVSHTTRAPRVNKGVPEQDGVEYHFIELNDAQRMLEAGEYVEAKLYSGNVYGTSAAEIQKAHDDKKIALTDIEVQGVAEYKAISKNVIAIFILPPDYDSWQQRLKGRYGEGGMDPAELRMRTETAVSELEQALAADYYHFIINGDLDKAVEAADKIAHNKDRFNEKDEEARANAKTLLSEIKARSGN